MVNYKRLFLKLARKYKAKVKFDKKHNNESCLVRDLNGCELVSTIHLKDIKTAGDFAGALHELAHSVYESEHFLDRIGNKYEYGYGKNICSKFILKLEFNAWKHATYLYDNWSEPMNSEFLKSIKTYIIAWEFHWKTKLDPKFMSRITNLDNNSFKL